MRSEGKRTKTKIKYCWLVYRERGFPCGSAGKESTCNAGRPGFDPWVGKILWRRERLPNPVFWPGEFHRLLHSPWGCKESDTTERLSLSYTERKLAQSSATILHHINDCYKLSQIKYLWYLELSVHSLSTSSTYMFQAFILLTSIKEFSLVWIEK